jgi:hypothetical protein
LFDSPIFWNDFRIHAVLTCCCEIQLDLQGKGHFFYAAYDTGEPVFVLGDEGLVLHEVAGTYFSTYPMPFADCSFSANVPKV